MDQERRLEVMRNGLACVEVGRADTARVDACGSASRVPTPASLWMHWSWRPSYRVMAVSPHGRAHWRTMARPLAMRRSAGPTHGRRIQLWVGSMGKWRW
jgi:hypothetical protein